MTDVHSTEIRRYNMSRIKGKNTKPEILVRKYLFRNGFRFRINVNKLPGTPDIVLSKYKTVIFVNGCFWHGHTGCKYYVVPKTRTEFWQDKIKTNIRNDNKVSLLLEEMGWRIIIIWACELKNKVVIIETLSKIKDQIKNVGFLL